MSGTSQMHNAGLSNMSRTEALEFLDNLGKATGGKPLRENSKTFTKLKKRLAFTTELLEFKRHICGDNQNLHLAFGRAYSKLDKSSTYDMTGTDLRRLVQAVKDELPRAEPSPQVVHNSHDAAVLRGKDAYKENMSNLVAYYLADPPDAGDNVENVQQNHQTPGQIKGEREGDGPILSDFARAHLEDEGPNDPNPASEGAERHVVTIGNEESEPIAPGGGEDHKGPKSEPLIRSSDLARSIFED